MLLDTRAPSFDATELILPAEPISVILNAKTQHFLKWFHEWLVPYVKAPSITYITLETKYHQPWKPNSTDKPRLSLGFTDLDNRLPCHTSSSWAHRCPSCGTGNQRTPRHPRSTARSTSYCDLPTNIPHFELSGLLTIVSMYERS